MHARLYLFRCFLKQALISTVDWFNRPVSSVDFMIYDMSLTILEGIGLIFTIFKGMLYVSHFLALRSLVDTAQLGGLALIRCGTSQI